MATRKSTTIKPGARRLPCPALPSNDPAIAIEPDAPGNNGSLRSSLETERMRLMTADAILACIEIALDPQASPPSPDLRPVLSHARQYLNYVIRRLDSSELARRTRPVRR